MPKQTFAFEPGGPKRLELTWKAFWRETTVSLDGQVLGVIPDQRELTIGREFTLPDGATLKVQRVSSWAATQLKILRNGKPVPGSASDTMTAVRTAYGIVYFVAGLNLVLGLSAMLFNIKFLQQIGIGVYSIIFGLLFLVLGYFTQRKSYVALILAIIVLALDGLLGYVLIAMAGQVPNIGGLVGRVILLIPMIQGVPAIKRLQGRVV